MFGIQTIYNRFMISKSKILYWLKVSRPGLWFQTIWLYLLPTSQSMDTLLEFNFWIGCLYVCFPLNLLVYGINDYYDIEVDQHNIRKDSFLFGARSSKKQIRHVYYVVLISNGPFWLYFLTMDIRTGLILLGIVLANLLYNHPRFAFKEKSPLEIVCQTGYLFIIPLSIIINGLSGLSFATYFYLILFCSHAHIMGQIMDIEPDRNAGRKTTAVLIGAIPAKMLVVGLILIESLILIFAFKAVFFALFLWISIIWLLLDALVIHGERSYSKSEFTLFGAVLNIVGYLSIGYVWYLGILR